MPVSGITDGYGPVLGQPARDYTAVDKMDFMTLLVAQIKNQDPMSPMDNAEFTSQITQFTMLDEMKSMNAKLEENLVVGQTINNTAMLGLIGKDVTVEGNKVWVAEGTASESVVAASGPGSETSTMHCDAAPPRPDPRARSPRCASHRRPAAARALPGQCDGKDAGARAVARGRRRHRSQCDY